MRPFYYLNNFKGTTALNDEGFYWVSKGVKEMVDQWDDLLDV